MSRPDRWKSGGFEGNFDADGTPPLPGWGVDKDGWHCRKLRDTDLAFNRDGCVSINMFTQGGKVFCRSADQARIIDGGGVV